ncbi:4a0c4069-92dc-4d75-8de3-c1067eb7c0f7 [Thermothielavioides terrestris]|jgi:hypothetical protein
MPND